MVCLTVNTPHSWNSKAKQTSWNCTEIASPWKQAVNSTIGHSPLPKDASCMPVVHWIQQALIERLMDGEARANKNEGGSADHAKGHDCQSTTLHIELCTFPMHPQCISKALLCTLMHCVSDSTCYATLHRPLHLHLHTCHLRLFVCLFTFVTGTHVACFVCLFPLLDWFH